jgi:hypothetical protein
VLKNNKGALSSLRESLVRGIPQLLHELPVINEEEIVPAESVTEDDLVIEDDQQFDEVWMRRAKNNNDEDMIEDPADQLYGQTRLFQPAGPNHFVDGWNEIVSDMSDEEEELAPVIEVLQFITSKEQQRSILPIPQGLDQYFPEPPVERPVAPLKLKRRSPTCTTCYLGSQYCPKAARRLNPCTMCPTCSGTATCDGECVAMLDQSLTRGRQFDSRRETHSRGMLEKNR